MVPFALSLVFHTLASIVWVGGVFFVRVVLIPSLHGWEAPERFAVLARVMPVFFRVIWGAVAVLLLTGYGVLLFGYSDGLGGGGVHVDVMQALGWVLILSFVFLDMGPFRSFLRARAAGDMDRAARKLDELGKGLSYALALGLLTAAVGATGSLWAY